MWLNDHLTRGDVQLYQQLVLLLQKQKARDLSNLVLSNLAANDRVHDILLATNRSQRFWHPSDHDHSTRQQLGRMMETDGMCARPMGWGQTW